MKRPQWKGLTLQSRDRLEKALLIIVLLLCAAILVETIGALLQQRAIAANVADTMQVLDQHNTKAGDYQAASAKQTQTLNEKGIFCPEKKKPSPPQVAGILGDSALINDKWCRVGDEHAGAKIVKIEPTEVTILWEDKEMKLAPLMASRPSGNNDKREGNRKKSKSAVADQNGDQTAASSRKAQPQDDSLAWIDIGMDDDVRDFLAEAFELMPSAQLDQIKNEWNNLSQEQKQQRLSEVREILDSGQADTVLDELRNM